MTKALRIIADRLKGVSAKELYWESRRLTGELSRLRRPQNHAFRDHVIGDIKSYMAGAVRPVGAQTRERADAAVEWILRAQAANGDGGVALGYFPCDQGGSGWRASYPETTGYIITSLLAYDRAFGSERVREAALRMARWEIDIQMPSGAVQGGPVCAPERQTPAAFNTGMVLDGLCSAYDVSRDPAILEGARRAADFLVNDLDESGYYRTNGAFVSTGEIKTYSCLCSWAVHRFGDIVDDERYRAAAVRSVQAALAQQQSNGWFAHNDLTHSHAPLTHTIGYTLQGVLEVGLLAKRDDFVAAVRRTADQLVARIQPSGYLPGRFYADWQPGAGSSCLTGSAQIAIVLYRLYEVTNEHRYAQAADKLVNYLKALQRLDCEDPGVNGAIAGSFPLFGGYMRGGYPNWATKYFLDALLLQDRHARATRVG